jgi:hypothetical protein
MANQGISTTVDGYFAMWNETDYDRRQAVIAATWSDDARYVDPLASAQGADGLHALVAGVHAIRTTIALAGTGNWWRPTLAGPSPEASILRPSRLMVGCAP